MEIVLLSKQSSRATINHELFSVDKREDDSLFIYLFIYLERN